MFRMSFPAVPLNSFPPAIFFLCSLLYSSALPFSDSFSSSFFSPSFCHMFPSPLALLALLTPVAWLPVPIFPCFPHLYIPSQALWQVCSAHPMAWPSCSWVSMDNPRLVLLPMSKLPVPDFFQCHLPRPHLGQTDETVTVALVYFSWERTCTFGGGKKCNEGLGHSQ